MFVDFNRVFKNKPQTQIAVPEALVNYMNKALPEGVKYVADDNGNCEIRSKEGSFTIGGFIFKPTEEQKQILGKNYTHQDVIDYSYNSQKPIQLLLKKDGFITLNGQEFAIDKISFNPLNPVKYVSGSFYMHPHPFPEPFEITIGNDKYERRLLMTRVPHNSVNIQAFESSSDDALKIKCLLDKNTDHITLNISFDLKNAKTIRDVVESTMIYNAYLDGKGFLLGHELDGEITDDGANRFDDNSAAFWEKVLIIESILEVNFIPPQDDVDFDTVCLVEQLYQNLINKIPTRDKQTISSLDGNWDFKSSGKDISESIGHPIFFECGATCNIDLFGVQKELPALLGVCNAVLSEYSVKGKKQKLILGDENPEKKRYTSIICFKNDNELKQYKETEHNKKIELFQKAKKPQEYL